ncbi:MAG: hypothetical protein GEU93_07600 [Propionibacteriales bacterium]|nr:hypothetical protein [Propionibacteriales bacterium]
MPGQLTLRLDPPAIPPWKELALWAWVDHGWQHAAACQTSLDDTWYPEPDSGDSAHAAKLACAVCPVRRSCLAYALADDEQHGIWGGATAYERERMACDLADGTQVDTVLARPGVLGVAA